MPKISVIVPVYNSEKWLNRCIESILNQTYNDFELILINDGSTDNSCIICDEYKEKDNRVTVIHKENGGVSSARNKGLDIATGEYITFIDSDDYIDGIMFENLLKYSKSEIDLIVSEWKGANQINNINSILYNKTDLLTYLINNKNMILRGPWGKLFKNNIIQKQKIRFDSNMSWGEDTYFCYSYLQYCNLIKLCEGKFYNYNRSNSNSITHNFKINNYYDYIKTYELQNYLINKFYIKNKLTYDVRFEYTNFMFLMLFKAAKKEYNIFYEYVNILLKDKNFHKYPKENIKLQILYYLIKFKMYNLLYLVLNK